MSESGQVKCQVVHFAEVDRLHDFAARINSSALGQRQTISADKHRAALVLEVDHLQELAVTSCHAVSSHESWIPLVSQHGGRRSQEKNVPRHVSA